jgi:hypothetical protein
MSIALVVMEPGSAWPGHVGDEETLVVLRSDRDMVASARERLATLERARQHVRVAVLACNGAIDHASGIRRAGVAGDLLAAVSRVQSGRLVLTAPPAPASRHLCQHLLWLVGTLTDRLRGTSATVTLRLTDERAHERVLSWSELYPTGAASPSPPPRGFDRISSATKAASTAKPASSRGTSMYVSAADWR